VGKKVGFKTPITVIWFAKMCTAEAGFFSRKTPVPEWIRYSLVVNQFLCHKLQL